MSADNINNGSAPENSRLSRRFAAVKAEGRPALVTFITAGDPNYEASREMLFGLPGAGADVIELGMPFSDPMADGPAIQASSQRALKAGQTTRKTLEMVREFRATDDATPIVLMGYYNPIYVYPGDRFLDDAKEACVDGLIIVDLPPEEDDELCIPAMERGISFIRLATPTTDNKRLPKVLTNSSGFVYYVSINGITGTAAPDSASVGEHVARIKAATDLPIAVGFGVKTPEQARELGRLADGVVVGSVLVNTIAGNLDASGQVVGPMKNELFSLVSGLADGLRNA